jgi:hypothetical protein
MKIVEWNTSGAMQFFSKKGFLNSKFQEIFIHIMWDHVSKYWEYLKNVDTDSRNQIVNRIASTILYDELLSDPTLINDITGEIKIHHGEMYIFNTRRKYLAPGDILELEKKGYIVVSPSCDLIIRKEGAKINNILLAEIINYKEFKKKSNELKSLIEKLDKKDKDKEQSKESKNLCKLMRQDWLNQDGRYFFLPPFGKYPGGVISFTNLKLEEYTKTSIDDLLEKRIISLTKDFVFELISRFSRYLTRLGQYPFMDKQLIDDFTKLIKP